MKVEQGTRVKWGYGYAWRNYESLTIEVFPIPFNHIFRWARNFYYWIAKPRKSNEDIAYNKGYDEGYKNATIHADIKLEKSIDKNIQVGWDLFNEMFQYRNLPKEEYYKKVIEIKDNLLTLQEKK